MGYCSDVVIEMTEWTFNAFLKYVKKAIGHDPFTYLDALGNNSIFNDATLTRFEDGQVAIQYSGIKWYDEYPEIKIYYDFVEEMSDANEPKFGMHLTRIGDDYDDNEYDSWGNITNYAMIERTIEFWGKTDGQEFELLL